MIGKIVLEEEPLLELSHLMPSCLTDLYKIKWNALPNINITTTKDIQIPKIYQETNKENTSDTRLIKGGVPILAIVATSQQILKAGTIVSDPLFNKIFRVPEIVYIVYLQKNIIEELNAWVNIIKNATQTLIFLDIISMKITIPIWETEEKAITDFKSVIFRQVAPTITLPINLIEIHTILKYIPWIIFMSRIIPIPPNFSKIPARIIDPNTGASTCAKGSHKCVLNIGNFTRNPKATDKDIILAAAILSESNLNRLTSMNKELLIIIIIQEIIGTDEIIV